MLSGVPGIRSITSTLREERPGTGRGTTTAGSAAEPSALWLTEAYTLSALWASCSKSR